MASKTFSMDDRRGLMNRVMRRFDKFAQYKLPFPMDPLELYRNAWTDKEWVAMRYLQENKPAAIRKNDHFCVFLTDDTSENHKTPHVHFNFDCPTPYPKVPIKMDELPDKQRLQFLNWVTAVNRMRSLRQEIWYRCSGLMGNPNGIHPNRYMKRIQKNLDPCLNNPTQLHAVWPEIIPFTCKEWRDGVRTSTFRTRVPHLLGYRVERDGRTHYCTPEMFRAEDEGATEEERRRFEQINNILLMVSLAKDVEDVRNYPDVYGEVD